MSLRGDETTEAISESEAVATREIATLPSVARNDYGGLTWEG